MSLPSTTQPYHAYTVSRTYGVRTNPVLSVNGHTGAVSIANPPVSSVNGQTGAVSIATTSVPSGDTTASDAWRLQAVKGDLFSNTQLNKIQQATSTSNGVTKSTVRNV